MRPTTHQNAIAATLLFALFLLSLHLISGFVCPLGICGSAQVFKSQHSETRHSEHHTSLDTSIDLPTELHPDLSARAFLGIGSSADFTRARKKGQEILCAFENPSRAKRTGFDQVSDLAAWGWVSKPWEADNVASTMKNFKTVLDAKGLSGSSPPLVGVVWTHEKETLHAGVKYPPTGGTFIVVLNPAQGLIVPARSYGPAYYVRQKIGIGRQFPVGAPLPKLSTWADVAYLTWLQHTTLGDKSRLKWVFNINCQNETTQSIVTEALKRDGVKDGTLPPWPGHTFVQKDKGIFGKGNSAYEAVLGTPNLLGSGWLVVQHQVRLGAKRLGSVTVYDSSGMDGFSQLSVLVEVLDGLG